MMNILQILFLIGFATNSLQVHNPTCQPDTSELTYKETLMIFVLDQAIEQADKTYHWYFLKQLACRVPISTSVKTFVVDNSVNNTNLIINKDSVYDSSKINEKLFNDYEKRPDTSDLCLRLENTLPKLFANDFVKNHPNVHFVIPTLDSTCKLPVFEDKSFVSIDFMPKTKGFYRYLTIGGEGVLHTNEKFASKNLIKTTDSLVDHMLHFNDAKIVEEVPACNCSESDGCTMKWLIGIGTVIISFVYLAIIIIWVRN